MQFKSIKVTNFSTNKKPIRDLLGLCENNSNSVLACIVSEVWLIIGMVFAVKGVPLFNAIVPGKPI